MAYRIQYRRATAATATANNVVLAAGEPGLETDTGKVKVGDGITDWNSLAYEPSTGSVATAKGEAIAAAALDATDKVAAVTVASLGAITPDGVDTKIADERVSERALQNSTYAPVGAGNIAATARKLSDAFGDVTLQFLGDSTPPLWYPALLDQMKVLYPHRSIRTYTWNDTTKVYGAAVTYFTGSGTMWINVYDGSKGGTIAEFAYLNADVKFASIQPDCFLIAYGLNHGNTATAIARLAYRQEWQRLAAVVKAAVPSADLILVAQNPRIDAGYEADLGTVRAQAVRSVAAEMGAAYAPVHDAYAASADIAALLDVGLVHPNPAGALLYGATIATLFRTALTSQPTPRVPSPLLIPATDLANNGDFARFEGADLDGWTATNAALTKDATNYESANGYAVRIQASAAAQSRISQALPIGRVRGKVITVAARMWIPAGQSNVTGRVEVITTGAAVNVGAMSPGTQATTRDCWTWEYISVRIPTDAVTATVKVISGATTEATADITVDRVTVTIGNQPHDTAPLQTADIAVSQDALTVGQMVPNRDLMSATLGHTSGTLALAYFTADKTETVSTLTAYTAAVAAAATPTLCRMAVYEVAANGDGSLVGSTPNDTTLFAATQTAYARALSVPFTRVKGRRYATAMLVVTGVGAPTFYGPLAVSAGPTSTVNSLAPATVGRLTGQTDLPATFTAASVVGYQQRSHMLLT